jgi:hypothetical protein
MSPTNRRKVVLAFAQTLQHEWDACSRLQIELVIVENMRITESSKEPSMDDI